MKTDTSGPCWLFLGADNGHGYGILGVRYPTRGTRYAHRTMYEAAHGPIPEGFEVAHKCDVRNCVRPSHLVLMDHAGNVHDMIEKQRQCRGSRHGGSKLTEDSVRDIRRRAAAGERRRDLAAEFDVSQTLIDKVVVRQIWRHVD